MTATNPAKLFGFDHKGRLAEGCDADLLLVDLEREHTLRATDLFYRNRHSAYIDAHFIGSV